MRFRRELVGAILCFANAVAAQEPRGILRGIVRDDAGQPVRDAVVALDPETAPRQARTDAQGQFQFPNVAQGPHELVVARLGYRPYRTTIQVGADGAQVTVELRRAPVQLDTIAVRATRPGLFGLVATRGMELLPHEPRVLAGAIVEVINTSFRATTGRDGRFSLPQLGEGSYSVLVRLDRYQSRMVPVYVPPDGGIEVSIVLDSTVAEYQKRDDDALRGISLRQRLAVNPSAFVGMHELRATEAPSLREALRVTPSTLFRGIVVRDDITCVYINGQPRPGMAASDIPIDDVEAVEVYGAMVGGVPTAQLAPWARDTFCGSGRRPGPDSQATDRPRGERAPRTVVGDNIARVIVVWTRGRR
jgi:hypothetical protein